MKHLHTLVRAGRFCPAHLLALLLLLLWADVATAQPTITALAPTRNLHNAPAGSSVAVTFSQAMSNAPAALAGVNVYGSQRGRLNNAGTTTVNGSTITFDPAASFKPGETIYTTLTTAVASAANTPLAQPHGYQFTAAAGAGPGTFAAGSEVSVGLNPREVATGDVDGDGDLDLVTNSGHNMTNTVSVRLNNGSGSFSGGTNVAVGLLPYGLELADVDGDGDLDLLTANFSGSLATFFNNGSGSFSAGPVLALASPMTLTTADLDGDGDLDAVASNPAGQELYVCLNNGSGTFSLGATLPVDGLVYSLAAGDLDGDGDPDLAVGASGFNKVSLLRNQGNGLSYAAAALLLPGSPSEVRLADLDGDGDLDLGAAANGDVYLRFNNGLGVFSGNTSLGVSQVFYLAFGDVDGDGDLDAVANARHLNQVSVRRNNGSGAFSGSYAAFVSKPNHLALGDLDGDLDLDLLVASEDNSVVSVRFNEVPLTVADLSPAPGRPNAPAASSVAVTFSQAISNSLASVASVQVFGTQRGGRLNNVDGSASVNGPAITFDPTTNFRAGETIWTTVTTAAASSANPAIRLNEGHVYQFTAAATGGSATFSSTPNIAAGFVPSVVVTADVNGDGNLDLLTANSAVNNVNNRVTLNLGNGNGSFGAGSLVNANPGLYTSMAVGDVDGDGDLDLLLAENFNDVVLLHKNNGAGAFGAAVSFSTYTNPDVLALADLDADGDLDLATSHSGTQAITIRFNDGNGLFNTVGSTASLTNMEVTGLALGDMDGDGRVDIVASGSTGSVQVFRNVGAGEFKAHSLVNAPNTSNAVRLGDLDADGDLDLVTSDWLNNTLSVRLNNGTGQLAGVLTYPISSNAYGTALGDLDGDGDLDLLVTDRGTNTTRLLRNNGNATFVAGTPLATPNAFDVALGDVDNDGDLDAFVSNYWDGGVSLRLNQAVPPVITALSPTRNQRNAARPGSVAITFDQPMSSAAASTGAVRVFSQQRGGQVAGTASANGNTITFDPAHDFRPGETVYTTITTAAQSSGGGNLAQPHVYQFTAAATGGTGTFVPGSDLSIPGPNMPYNLAAGDVDGDGDVDLLTAIPGPGTNSVGIQRNNGSAGFTAAPDVAVDPNPFSLALGDVDADGDLDLLAGCSGGMLTVRLNNGSGTFAGGSSLLAGGSRLEMLALGDVDGDGDLDLAAGRDGGNNISLHLNNGSGTFSAGNNLTMGLSPGSIALGDMDNDGDLDLLTANFDAHSVSLRFNNGSGTFGAMSTVAVAANPRGLALGDVDGDGDLDFVTSCLGANNVSVRRNNGNGTFSGNSNPAMPTGTYAVALGDVDGDGDLDLLATNSLGGGSVTRLLNSGNGTFGSGLETSVAEESPSLVLADFDGDGDLDFATSAANAKLLSVRLNGTAVLPDLVVDTVTPVTGGPYNNVTVTGSGVGTLAANLSVAGTLRIEDGGVLNDGCFTITGPGSFLLEAGGTLGICSPQGISLAGPTGGVQVAGSRTYSDDASYVYNGTQAQATGNGLPAQVRNLTADNPARVRLSGSVAVRRMLTVANAGNLQLASHNLLLPSDASGTAMVVNSGTGIVENDGAGTATMQRHISPTTAYAGPGYRHYSSPMQASRVADLATTGFTPYVDPAYNALPTPSLPAQFPNVFGYQESRLTAAFPGFDIGWYSPAALSDQLVRTTGYTVNISPSAKVALSGALNNGPLNTGALSRSFGAEAGWHLLGNPYPAPLDWGRVTSTPGAIPAGLADAVYVFEPTDQYGGFYRSYVNGIGTQGFTGVLPAMQGFFVRATQAVPGGFTFRNEFRLTQYADPAFHRQATGHQALLRLTLSGSTGGSDEAVVYLEQGATLAGTDVRYDAAKLPNPGRSVSLASRMPGAGNEPLAINGLPLLNTAAPATRVPLLLSLPAAGSYQLTRAALANFDPALAITLVDHATGTRTDLRATASYSFTVTQAGALASRFELLLGRPGSATATTAGTELSFSVWPNPATGKAAFQLSLTAPVRSATATLHNVLGQVVATHGFSGAATEVSTLKLAPGTYLLTVTVPGQAPTTRRVVVE